MVRQQVDGIMKDGTFVQRPGTAYFHILWRVLAPAASNGPSRFQETAAPPYGTDSPPPYTAVELNEAWIHQGGGVWRRTLEHCGSTQWGISTIQSQHGEWYGPDLNPNLSFTCKRMLRLPNDKSEAALDTICSKTAQALVSHRKKHKCTCDLRFLRLGRVDAAFNDPNAHRCSDTDLLVEHWLPGKTVKDWIQLHNGLCFCSCFSSGVHRPTRFSRPRPDHDDHWASNVLRPARPFGSRKVPWIDRGDPNQYLYSVLDTIFSCQIDFLGRSGNRSFSRASSKARIAGSLGR